MSGITDYDIDFNENGTPSRNCPACGDEAIQYYDTDYDNATSGWVTLLWECDKCGAVGKDEFSLSLDTRYVDMESLEGFEVTDVGDMRAVWEA